MKIDIGLLHRQKGLSFVKQCVQIICYSTEPRGTSYRAVFSHSLVHISRCDSLPGGKSLFCFLLIGVDEAASQTGQAFGSEVKTR